MNFFPVELTEAEMVYINEIVDDILHKKHHRTFISGMINEIPRREYSTIELSVFKRIKPPAITAKCLACLAGNNP